MPESVTLRITCGHMSRHSMALQLDTGKLLAPCVVFIFDLETTYSLTGHYHTTMSSCAVKRNVETQKYEAMPDRETPILINLRLVLWLLRSSLISGQSVFFFFWFIQDKVSL